MTIIWIDYNAINGSGVCEREVVPDKCRRKFPIFSPGGSFVNYKFYPRIFA